jgi:hypothetical protein
MAAGKYADIDTCILFAVRDLLDARMNLAVSDTDPLRLKYIGIGQLQQDFTTTPYSAMILLDFPNDLWGAGSPWATLEGPINATRRGGYVEMGIGKGQLWIVRIALRSWVSLKTLTVSKRVVAVTPDMAVEQRSEWFNRILEALLGDPLLGSITNKSGTQTMVGGNAAVVEKTKMTQMGERGAMIITVDMQLAYLVEKRLTSA